MTEYKLVKHKVILEKKRNIYKKKGSNKEYVKYKCKMMNVVKYKKIKTKKLPKKRKLSRKRGGYYVTTQFERLEDHIKAHVLLRGIQDQVNQQKVYSWEDKINPHTEALIKLNDYHISLIIYHKKHLIDKKINLYIFLGRLIKINITHRPKAFSHLSPHDEHNSPAKSSHNSPVKSSPIRPRIGRDIGYISRYISGIPTKGNTCDEKDGNEKKVHCRIYHEKTKRYLVDPDGKCYKKDQCIVNAEGIKSYDKGVISARMRRDNAQNAAYAAATRKGGKKRKVDKSVKIK